MLSQVTNFLKRNKKIMYYLGFFAVMYFALGDSVFAICADGTTNCYTSGEWADAKVAKETLSIVNVIFVIAWMFIGLLTQLVALFLNPGWINGNIVGIAPHMKTIWIMISNIVYFIFAILLIVIAFMNIIWKWDKWELKQALPKFIVWILIVPFTWFFVQFILSISALLTVSALTLPFDTFPSVTGTYVEKKIIPNNCVMHIWDKWDSGLESLSNLPSNTTKEQLEAKVDEIYKCDKDKLSIKDIIWDGDSIFGVMSIYTYWILRIDQFDIITDWDLDWVKTIVSLWISWIINILFVLIMLILLVSITLALFTRWIWLWLYAMFSPIFGLLYFFDKAWWGWEGVMKKFSITEFIKLALVPVYVAAALSFGLFFLFVVSTTLNKTGAEGNKQIVLEKNWAKLTMWKLSYWIEWSFLSTANKEWDTLFSEIQGGIWTLIIDLMALVILWMGVMAALKTSEITWTVVEPIAAFGKSIWDLAMKSPQYAPIFGGLSAQWLNKIWKMPQNALETKTANKISPFQGEINKAFWVSTIDASVKAELKEMWNDGISNAELPKIQAKMRSLAEKFGTDNSEYRALFKQYNSALKKWSWSSLHLSNEDLFDSSNKFTDEAVKTLFDSNTQSGAGQRAVSQGYASKVLAAGWTAEIVEEGKAGFVDGKSYDILKGKSQNEDTNQDQVTFEIADSADWKKTKDVHINVNRALEGDDVTFAMTQQDAKGERSLMMTIWDNWTWMNFEKWSSKAFNSDVKTLDQLYQNLTTNDRKQLKSILTNMNPIVQGKFLNAIFANLNQVDINSEDFKTFVK